jgi:hypothetical protein
MERKAEIRVGDIFEQECKICNVVRPMRFDGLLISNETLESAPAGFYDDLKDLGSYTCQICSGTFSFPTRISYTE